MTEVINLIMSKYGRRVILTYDEACELLGGVSKSTIHRLIDEGELTKHFYKRGMVTTESVIKYYRKYLL